MTLTTSDSLTLYMYHGKYSIHVFERKILWGQQQALSSRSYLWDERIGC